MAWSKAKKQRVNAERKFLRERVRDIEKIIGNTGRDKYDRVQVVTADRRRAVKSSKCPNCKRGFEHVEFATDWKDVIAICTETETSAMRGDDEVQFWHVACFIDSHPVSKANP